MLQERNQDCPNFWQAALILFLLFAVEFLICAAFSDAGVRLSAGDPKYMGVVSVLSFGTVFSLLISYKNLSYRNLFHPSGQSVARTVVPLLLPIAIGTSALMVLATEILNVLCYMFPLSTAERVALERLYSGGIVTIITACVVAPFLEEMLFRGIFLRSFLRNYQATSAILLSSFLFGIAHLNIYQFAVALLIGVFAGWLYVRTRSLWPSILVHAIYNGLSFLLYSKEDLDQAPSFISYEAPSLMVAATLIFFLSMGWLWKTTGRLKIEVTTAK